MSSVEQIKPKSDHLAGPLSADNTLIEYGSYACSYCRDAQKVISRVQEKFGEGLIYVFRHDPLRSDPWSVPSAMLAEYAEEQGIFWEMHTALMTRPIHSREDLQRVAEPFGISSEKLDEILAREDLLKRIESEAIEAEEANITSTPTFFINGHLYEGAWDEMSLIEALNEPIAVQIDRVARDFAGWAPGTGMLLAFCAVISMTLANSPASHWFHSLLETPIGLQFGEWSYAMSAHAVINDCLMSMFFLVVGLEIKREVTIGELSELRVAALPIGAAIGGMAVPALLYLGITWGTPMTSGWGIPMATDIAFALGLLALLGRRVPVSLKVFLTALAIVDDLGAILVIAIFYGHGFDTYFAVLALLTFATLVGINLVGVYSAVPYAVLGIILWVYVYASGLHATLAGILLAMTIPTRPPPNLEGLLAQAKAITEPWVAGSGSDDKKYPERGMVRALDAVYERIEAPAHRIERVLEPWSSFFILPIFALSNAGVALVGAGDAGLVTVAIVVGLVLGKPLGIGLACWIMTRTGIASLPSGVNWPMIIGVGLLAGVGFTMSIFISNEAFVEESLIEGAKIAVLAASAMAASMGLLLLNKAAPRVGQKSEFADGAH
jgi:NhaA family Na+:H+ antiporter